MDSDEVGTEHAFGTVNFIEHSADVLDTYRLRNYFKSVGGVAPLVSDTATDHMILVDGATFTRTTISNQPDEPPLVQSAHTFSDGPFWSVDPPWWRRTP